MAAKKSITTPALDVPQTLDEAADRVRNLGRLERSLSAIDKALNDQIALLQEQFAAQAEPLRRQRDLRVQEIAAYASANRTELLHGKAKMVKLPGGGEFGWRLSPPRVNITKTDKVLAWLKANGYGRFIRTKEEIDKEAMLAEQDAVRKVQGASVTQTENFYIRPAELQVDVPAGSTKINL